MRLQQRHTQNMVKKERKRRESLFLASYSLTLDKAEFGGVGQTRLKAVLQLRRS